MAYSHLVQDADTCTARGLLETAKPCHQFLRPTFPGPGLSWDWGCSRTWAKRLVENKGTRSESASQIT